MGMTSTRAYLADGTILHGRLYTTTNVAYAQLCESTHDAAEWTVNVLNAAKAAAAGRGVAWYDDPALSHMVDPECAHEGEEAILGAYDDVSGRVNSDGLFWLVRVCKACRLLKPPYSMEDLVSFESLNDAKELAPRLRALTRALPTMTLDELDCVAWALRDAASRNNVAAVFQELVEINPGLAERLSAANGQGALAISIAGGEE
jgi:hypothetical protein